MTIEQILDVVAARLEKRVGDLVVVVLDRPRHEAVIKSLRQSGCGIRLISDGDVAAAIKCLGGEQSCRIWPKRPEERQRLLTEEDCREADLNKIWTVNEMAKGDHIIFAATGISDSPMLRGIRYHHQHCITESILMRVRNRTVRRIETYHDVARKTIRLDTSGEEVQL